MRVKYILALAIGLLFSISVFAGGRGFAIVVDPQSYREAKAEIEAYAKSIERQGLKVYLVEDRWGVPDSIRMKLVSLYEQKDSPIEGCVFIGDIPVPMVLNAQHMTTAFKVNQATKNLQRLGVPSDRFYDDFDLKFSFVQRDEKNPLYYYYSLDAESAQFLAPTIYSGRIKPLSGGEVSKYELLRRYLQKIVRLKGEHNPVDQILYFSGHGYISESPVARIDEKIALLENFPWLKKQKNGIQYMDHKRDDFIKYRLMSEVQRNDLDIAILHHHGAPAKEYLNSYPEPKNAQQELESARLFMRTKIRSAVGRGTPIDTVKNYYCKNYGVPLSWLDNVMDPEVIAADSVLAHNLDLHLEDFDSYHPNARVVILDACFNGSFHLDRYLAGGYLFNSGNTAVVVANSVNALQDKWSDRHVGLLGLGMCAGHLVQHNPYLESHLLGDPTYCFATSGEAPELNEALAGNDVRVWKKQLQSTYPAVQLMAIEELAEHGVLGSEDLLRIFQTNPNYIVRLGCMLELARHGDDNYIRCLDLAVDDSYELVSRMAVTRVGKSGDPRLIPALIRVAIENNTGERIAFNLKSAMSLFDREALLQEFRRQYAECDFYFDKEKAGSEIEKSIRYNAGRWDGDVEKIYSGKGTKKEQLAAIRTLRNNPLHTKVGQLLKFVKVCPDEEVQVALLEALGWFNQSYTVPQIARVMEEMKDDAARPAKVRNEALKTLNRLNK